MSKQQQQTEAPPTDGKLRITLRELVALGACSGQRDLFRETFGSAAIVDEANAERAVTAGLNVDWIARSVLTGDYLAEYERSTRLAEAEYERSMQQAEAEYERSTALAFVAAYRRQAMQAAM
jgi:hypothetical protein